jgi:hypothetical protein
MVVLYRQALEVVRQRAFNVPPGYYEYGKKNGAIMRVKFEVSAKF